jgi:hypothetical protein
MKILSLLTLSLSLVNIAFANLVGNPQAPDIPKVIAYTKNMPPDQVDYWLNARLDYEKEYCTDMDLEFSAGSIVTATTGAGDQRCEFSGFSGNFLILTANILRRMDFYAKAGAVIPNFNFAATDVLGSTHHFKSNTKSLPAWALGAKFLVFKAANTCLAVEGSYFQTDHRNVQVYSVVAPVIPVANTLSWYNWQVSAALSYQATMFIPYAGAKFSRTIVSFNPSTPALVVDPFKMDNRRKFGFFFGTSILAARYMEINLEGRLIDEQSFSATMGFRF